MNLHLAAFKFIKDNRDELSPGADLLALSDSLEQLLIRAYNAGIDQERRAVMDTMKRVERCVVRVFARTKMKKSNGH